LLVVYRSLPLELSTPSPITTEGSNTLSPAYHALSKSADDILGQMKEDSPPPKPPLPHQWSNNSGYVFVNNFFFFYYVFLFRPEEVYTSPPPLPPKRKPSSSCDELSPPMQLWPSPQPSHSPSSSMSVSSDDVDSPCLSAQSSPVKAVPRLSTYENFSTNHITDLTQQIQQLTTDIQSRSGMVSVGEFLRNDGRPPPLPDKEKQGVYDNMPVMTHRALSAQSSASPRTSCAMRTSHTIHGFTSASSSSLSSSGKVTYRASTSTTLLSRSVHMTLSKETYSSSETYSSASCESADPFAPALPPKKKHGEPLFFKFFVFHLHVLFSQLRLTCRSLGRVTSPHQTLLSPDILCILSASTSSNGDSTRRTSSCRPTPDQTPLVCFLM
jgi:hypothetical protein